MSDNINRVNYAQFSIQAKEIWEKTADLHRQIYQISQEVKTINNIWTGKKCNEFLKIWNNNVATINSYFSLVGGELASYINRVGKRFAQIEGASYKDWNYGVSNTTEQAKMTDENTLRFLTDKVHDFHVRLDNTFKKSANEISTMYDLVKKLPWDSSSSETFFPILKKTTTQAKESLSSISTKLNNSVIATENEVKAQEALNKQEASSFGSSK